MIDSLPVRDVVVIGDLNAYGEEDPVDVLQDARYIDLIEARLEEGLAARPGAAPLKARAR